MISVPKSALFASLMAITTTLVSAAVTQKELRKAYGASANAYFTDGCEVLRGSSFSVNVDSTKNRFTSSGNGQLKVCEKFDVLMISYTQSSCDNSTIRYQYGEIYDQSNYGNSVPTTFNMDTKNLREASVQNLELPVFENTCTYECTEVCYPEIWGYGTCPEDEPPSLNCYETACGEDIPLGIAEVSVTWDAIGTSAPYFSRYITRETGPYGYNFDSKSTGNFRSELDVVITATLNGDDLFSSPPESVSGYLSNSKSKTVTQTDNQAEYRRRMQLLNGN